MQLLDRSSRMVRCFLLGLSLLPAAAKAQSESRAGGIDVHVHLKPDRKGDYEASVRGLLEQMDASGVERALLLPAPRVLENDDPRQTRALFDIARQHSDRFSVIAGGSELNTLLHAYGPAEVDDAVRARFRAAAERLVESGAKAFGEMAACHLSFKVGHPYENASPDHPLFLLLAEIAGLHGIPIDLHMEAVPQEIPLPKGLHRPNADTLPANIESFERLLEHEPSCQIVWQHIGWDNTGGMTTDLLRRLLRAHPNLFLALRVVSRTRTFGGDPMPNRIVDSQWKILPEWLDLFEEYPDRFVVGSDEFFLATGKKSQGAQSFDLTWTMLAQLPDDLRQRIGRQNAIQVYRLE